MLGDGEVGELDVLRIRPHGDDGELVMLTGLVRLRKRCNRAGGRWKLVMSGDEIKPGASPSAELSWRNVSPCRAFFGLLPSNVKIKSIWYEMPVASRFKIYLFLLFLLFLCGKEISLPLYLALEKYIHVCNISGLSTLGYIYVVITLDLGPH